MAAEKSERIALMMSPKELKALDAWRAREQIWSRSEAIRRLVALGVKRKPAGKGPSQSPYSALVKPKEFP